MPARGQIAAVALLSSSWDVSVRWLEKLLCVHMRSDLVGTKSSSSKRAGTL